MTLKNAKYEAVLQAFIGDPERVGWRAYQAVYPKSSQHACETAWSRLLKSAEFSARKAELEGVVLDAAVALGVMSSQDVLLELSKLGRASIQDVIVAGADTGEVLQSLREMRPEHAAAVQELTIETYLEGGGDAARAVKRVKVKLHSKTSALEMLGKYHKLFVERRSLEDPDGKPAGTAAAKITDPLELARRVAFLLGGAADKKPAPKAAKKTRR